MSVLPYWIEEVGSNYKIWVRTTIPANSSIELYILKFPGYQPDGDSVFIYFDDFTVGYNGTLIGSAYYDATNKMLILTPNDYNQHGYYKMTYVSPPFEIKFTSYTPGDGADAIFMWYGIKPGGEDDTYTTMCILDEYNNYMGIRHYDSLTEYSCNPIGTHVNVVQVWSNKITFSNDITTLTKDITSDYSGTELGIGGRTGGVKNLHALKDYIYVRKLADQEPSVSVNQISQTIWKVTVTNPNNYDLVDYQVAVPGSGIVTSKTDSLMIIRETESYWIDSSRNLWVKVQLNPYECKTVYVIKLDSFSPNSNLLNEIQNSVIQNFTVDGEFVADFDHILLKSGTLSANFTCDNKVVELVFGLTDQSTAHQVLNLANQVVVKRNNNSLEFYTDYTNSPNTPTTTIQTQVGEKLRLTIDFTSGITIKLNDEEVYSNTSVTYTGLDTIAIGDDTNNSYMRLYNFKVYTPITNPNVTITKDNL